MHRYAQDNFLKTYLIEDEIIDFKSRGYSFAYRLRIWRRRGAPAVVLASQLPGGAPPCFLRSSLANFVYQAYLGFLDDGMFYFEAEATEGTPRLAQITFDAIGHGLRRRLVQPVERSRCWCDLLAIVGPDFTPDL